MAEKIRKQSHQKNIWWRAMVRNGEFCPTLKSSASQRTKRMFGSSNLRDSNGLDLFNAWNPRRSGRPKTRWIYNVTVPHYTYYRIVFQVMGRLLWRSIVEKASRKAVVPFDDDEQLKSFSSICFIGRRESVEIFTISDCIQFLFKIIIELHIQVECGNYYCMKEKIIINEVIILMTYILNQFFPHGSSIKTVTLLC